MVRLYYRILLLIILLFFLFNLTIFVVTGNVRHLIMPSFFKERAVSLYYYATNKAMDTSFSNADLDKSPLEKIRILSIDKIDESLLMTLEGNTKGAEPFSLIGSPAPTYLLLKDFHKLSSNNPFSEDENISVAVKRVHELHSKGLSGKDLLLAFMLGDKINKVKFFAPSEYSRALKLAEEFERKGY